MYQPRGGAGRWGATEQESRAPEEIFAHHIEALRAEDIEGVLLDYADDACLITPYDMLRGRDAIRGFFARLFQLLPQAEWDVATCLADNILLLEWTADSATKRIPDGVDTFIFRDGLIQAQTVRFTLISKA